MNVLEIILKTWVVLGNGETGDRRDSWALAREEMEMQELELTNRTDH